MKVFKFGGASVKDADSVRNVAKIIEAYPNEKIIIVVSAMGKTTNALEKIVYGDIFKARTSQFPIKRNHVEIQKIIDFHRRIAMNLFEDHDRIYFMEKGYFRLDTIHSIYSYAIDSTIENEYKRLCLSYDNIDESFTYDYNFDHTESKRSTIQKAFYDYLVSLGEFISTQLVNDYLEQQKITSKQLDASELIHTDATFKNANVDWKKTKTAVRKAMEEAFSQHDVVITQGFIGGTIVKGEFHRTTLGREGSDYSAAIFAHCMDAESVTIWKDVDGMFNADPKQFPDAVKLDQISYNEATELAYYGASVIHPKTIKPLQNKNIPLYIKSFINPNAPGTVIQSSTKYDNKIPSFIVKENQILISLRLRDFSFIAEAHLGKILQKLDQIRVKVNLMQNSALSFSFVVDEPKIDIDDIQSVFGEEYEIRYNKRLELITIRHTDQKTIDRLTKNTEILIIQHTRETMQFVIKRDDLHDDLPF